jgi:DNA invertase Pin-like site-specific DNA recombinase
MIKLSIAGTTVRRWLKSIKIEKVDVFKPKKEEMIKMINEGKRCVDIVKELSISRTTYRRWLNEYKTL